VSKQPKVYVHAALPLGHERHGKVGRPGSQVNNTLHEHDAHLYSHSGQGIRAGLSRLGTVPSRVPVSIRKKILTPAENADVHVSFQGAELGGDYFCVTQIAFFVNRPGKGGSAAVIKPRKE
jgi:hypothetical protein